MVGGNNSVFKYKTVKGYLHKIPSIIKFILFLFFSVICMSFPSSFLLAGIFILIFTAFVCEFTLQEQLTDLKPAFFYAVLMYALSLFSNLFDYLHILKNSNNFFTPSLLTLFFPRHDFIRITLRLLLIIQISALFFRTTSSIEIRQCLSGLEQHIKFAFSRLPFMEKRISKDLNFTQSLCLFLGFIPEIFTLWSNINLAWKARSGKNGINKIKILVFVLISVSFEKAAVKARAIEARSYYERNFK